MSAYEALGALADPTRRRILDRLAERPRSVGDLAGELPVSRPAVSQHLRVLREAGLVSDVAAGTRRIYRVNARGIDELRSYLDSFWSRALAAYAEAVDQPQQPEGAP